MKKSGRHLMAKIFVVVLAVIVLILEFALRFAEPFSPSAYKYIQGLFKTYPLVFGSLWSVLMLAGISVAYLKYREKKTTGKLVVLILWVTILAAIVTCRIFRMF